MQPEREREKLLDEVCLDPFLVQFLEVSHLENLGEATLLHHMAVTPGIHHLQLRLAICNKQSKYRHKFKSKVEILMLSMESMNTRPP